MKERKIKMNTKRLLMDIIYLIVVIILILVLFFIMKNINFNLAQKSNFESSVKEFSQKNQEKIFSIDKIVFFSSSDSKNKLNSSINFTIDRLYAYTDIAIYINNNSEEVTLKNTLKNVKILNVKITKEPSIGEPNLYFKSINDFAKSEFNEKYKIENEIEFKTTSENENDLSEPVLYNNCANPITLSYVNKNIKNNYVIKDMENPIIYNGKLLERCGVTLDSLQTSISFDVEIENNNNEKYKTTVYFDIPYSNDEKSIYDGNLTINRDVNFNFYRCD